MLFFALFLAIFSLVAADCRSGIKYAGECGSFAGQPAFFIHSPYCTSCISPAYSISKSYSFLLSQFEQHLISILILAPDNTAINERDRGGKLLTADNQGLGASDTQLTQKIRAAIVGRSNLSLYARNIKIITRDGQVTLRGPVRSIGERQLIDQIAAEHASKAVTNLLEVAKPSQDPLFHIRMMQKRKNRAK